MQSYIIHHLPILINSGGLVFDAVGAFLIYCYGIPEKIDRDGLIALCARADNNTEELEKARKYDRRSRLGFLILIFGFVLQLASNWVK